MNNSKIEWTDHTFNPWWGCMKVSDGCKHCYAETLDNRWKGGHWGPGSTRRQMSESYWQQPLKWNKSALTARKPAKVFCASMADVFEGHIDTKPHLERLFMLIRDTPLLIWQLLTKRPENIMKLIPESWRNRWPDNVWIGTSIENQDTADSRIPHLLRVPAGVRFLSCEPLLGPVDLSIVYGLYEYDDGKYATKVGSRWADSPDWVIAGGESGHGGRPMHPDWVRMIRDQCAAAEVPFFFKQWGEWGDDGGYMVRVGKKMAGRILDGKEHNEFPTI
jgi:protein gp37